MAHHATWQRSVPWLLPILGALLLSLAGAGLAVAQDEGGLPIPASAPPVPVETWVQNRLNSGEEADLSKYTDGEPVLMSDFVRRLLTRPAIQGAETPPWLTVKSATIRGPLLAQDIVV